MSAFVDRVERLSAAFLAAGVVCLGFQGIGPWSWRTFLPFNLVDFFWMLAFALAVAVAVARRKVGFANRIVPAVLVLAAAFAVSGLLSEDPTGAARDIVRQFLMVASVWTIARVSSREESRSLILRVFVVGGVAATVVSLIGYLVVVLVRSEPDGILPFVFTSAHPLFDGWPRLSGTHGHSPQHFGEFLAMLMAIASIPLFAAPRFRTARLRHFVAVGLAGLALLLTFSFAIVGAAIALAGLAALRLTNRTLRFGLGIAVLLAIVLATMTMNIGRETDLTTEEALGGVPCETVDSHHEVVAFDRGVCLVSVVDWPHRSIETLYAAAKRTAIAVFVHNPILGVGPGGFDRAARDSTREKLGTDRGAYYETPHNLYLYALSTAGTVGGLALLFLLFSIFSLRPSRVGGDPRAGAEYRAIWWMTVAFLVLGINVDVITYRGFWFLLGLLATHRHRSETRATHP